MKRNKKKYRKLRGKIVAEFGTMSNFAEALGTSKQHLSNKLNGKSNITYKDVVIMSNKLHIAITEIGEYFFADEV